MSDNEINNSEQNEVDQPGIQAEKKEHKSDTKEKLDIKKLVNSKYVEYKAEFRKIIWPSRKVLLKQTATVVVVSLVFGLIIFGMDTIYGLGIQLFVSLID